MRELLSTVDQCNAVCNLACIQLYSLGSAALRPRIKLAITSLFRIVTITKEQEPLARVSRDIYGPSPPAPRENCSNFRTQKLAWCFFHRLDEVMIQRGKLKDQRLIEEELTPNIHFSQFCLSQLHTRNTPRYTRTIDTNLTLFEVTCIRYPYTICISTFLLQQV